MGVCASKDKEKTNKKKLDGESSTSTSQAQDRSRDNAAMRSETIDSLTQRIQALSGIDFSNISESGSSDTVSHAILSDLVNQLGNKLKSDYNYIAVATLGPLAFDVTDFKDTIHENEYSIYEILFGPQYLELPTKVSQSFFNDRFGLFPLSNEKIQVQDNAGGDDGWLNNESKRQSNRLVTNPWAAEYSKLKNFLNGNTPEVLDKFNVFTGRQKFIKKVEEERSKTLAILSPPNVFIRCCHANNLAHEFAAKVLSAGEVDKSLVHLHGMAFQVLGIFQSYQKDQVAQATQVLLATIDKYSSTLKLIDLQPARLFQYCVQAIYKVLWIKQTALYAERIEKLKNMIDFYARDVNSSNEEPEVIPPDWAEAMKYRQPILPEQYIVCFHAFRQMLEYAKNGFFTHSSLGVEVKQCVYNHAPFGWPLVINKLYADATFELGIEPKIYTSPTSKIFYSAILSGHIGDGRAENNLNIYMRTGVNRYFVEHSQNVNLLLSLTESKESHGEALTRLRKYWPQFPEYRHEIVIDGNPVQPSSITDAASRLADAGKTLLGKLNILPGVAVAPVVDPGLTAVATHIAMLVPNKQIVTQSMISFPPSPVLPIWQYKSEASTLMEKFKCVQKITNYLCTALTIVGFFLPIPGALSVVAGLVNTVVQSKTASRCVQNLQNQENYQEHLNEQRIKITALEVMIKKAAGSGFHQSFMDSNTLRAVKDVHPSEALAPFGLEIDMKLDVEPNESALEPADKKAEADEAVAAAKNALVNANHAADDHAVAAAKKTLEAAQKTLVEASQDVWDHYKNSEIPGLKDTPMLADNQNKAPAVTNVSLELEFATVRFINGNGLCENEEHDFRMVEIKQVEDHGIIAVEDQTGSDTQADVPVAESNLLDAIELATTTISEAGMLFDNLEGCAIVSINLDKIKIDNIVDRVTGFSPGPNAILDFVDTAVEELLKDVPDEESILADALINSQGNITVELIRAGL